MNKKNNKNLGFTLIEMLVVVAIIVILGTIFFVKMKASVEKSDDIKLKAKMNEALVQGKLYYSKYGYYSTNDNPTPIVVTSPVYDYRTGTYFGSLGHLLDEIGELTGDNITLDSPNTTTNHGYNITYGVGSPYSGSNSGSYAMAAPLKTQNIISVSSGIDYYCIDSSLEEGKVIDEVTQMTGQAYATNEIASCGN